MKSIVLKDATFIYPNDHIANEELNLKINRGERVAIVGQNGAGKTTAVKLINGLNKPTHGDVFIDGKNTKDKTVAQISAYVGYVFQNPDDQVFNNSVEDEIEYTLRYLKLPSEEIERRVKRAVELTGIEDFLDMKPFDVPFAIRKFVTIAVILALETPYLILDEPTAGQDLKGINKLSKLLDVLEEEEKTVITISHDMEFVADNFTRVVAMANKKIIADDIPRNIFWNESVVAASKIKKPEIGELAKEVGIEEKIIYRDELVNKISCSSKPHTNIK
ncbi:hypothetical protein GCM10007063_25820 [Lentibacillus kapialis]|uniref:ABC transporter domain-containing protein n=1 Tax=Lentibacillus kapialis TaxID=340214 RepID=A0A917PZL6_9BACI|nr:ABC transporter ATP-binding protein [Lentibacillus kapialis]GGK02344.1 hypothetical protein GCM10007063_25820 [Lentibacillus kapialis]